jgi:hypothetical protein
MTDAQLNQLIDEIDAAGPDQFWGDSDLFDRAARVRDVRVVRALALLHHSFSNKEAFSAHVVRNTIKTIDQPQFGFLWSMIDAETDARRIVEGLEDFSYLPWAAAYVLGEIGGAAALRGAVARLSAEHSVRHYLIVRLTSHLVVRYLKIGAAKPPTVTMIDLKTGEMTRGLPAMQDTLQYKTEMLKREQGDELFIPVESSLAADLRARLSRIPDHILNLKREVFYDAIEKLPKRYA